MATTTNPEDTHAGIVACNSLKAAREFIAGEYPIRTFMAYLAGKAQAAAFIEPSIVTLAAENEIRFLEHKYAKRHNLFKG